MRIQDDNSKPPIAERRPNRRKRVLMSGVVSHADGAYSFDCTFRNLSDSGALVAIGTHVPFPSEFYLISVRDGIVYELAVVHNTGREVGVRFKNSFALSAIPDRSLNYLKRLWLAKA